VRHLGDEVRIDVPEPDTAERRAARSNPTATDAEERLVVQDVLALVHAEFLTGGDRTPPATDRHVDLTHVDLGAEAVVVAATALHFRGEAEVHTEVGVPFLAHRREGGKGREEAGPVVEALLGAATDELTIGTRGVVAAADG